MKLLNLLSVVTFLTILFISCNNAVDVKIEREKLLNSDREFAAKSEELGAAEAFNMFLADNAMMMPSRGNPVYGREEIYKSMSEDDNKLEWVPQDGEVALSGELGYTWGLYKYIYPSDDGEMDTAYGKYLNIWKMDEKGDWKVLIDIGNSSPKPE